MVWLKVTTPPNGSAPAPGLQALHIHVLSYRTRTRKGTGPHTRLQSDRWGAVSVLLPICCVILDKQLGVSEPHLLPL